MLKLIEGDLFCAVKAPCVIAHGCNSMGYMGEGFAKQMRERFPENYLEYRQWCSKGKIRPGQWLWYCESGITIFNLVTQLSYGYDKETVYVDYPSVEKLLKVVAKYQLAHRLPVHMPFIGGGHAHGDRTKLMGIFEEVFKDADAMLHLLPTKD